MINPKIVILALNPRYTPLRSEAESKKILESLNNNYELYIENINQVFNKEAFINEKNNAEKHMSTLKWWKDTLKELIDQNDDWKTFLDNVAIFNYCGYHSISYKDLPKEVVNNGKLETELGILDYVKNLIDKDNTVVIKLWGNAWKPVLKGLNEETFSFRWWHSSSIFSAKKSYMLEKAESDEDFKKMLTRINVIYKIDDVIVLKHHLQTY